MLPSLDGRRGGHPCSVSRGRSAAITDISIHPPPVPRGITVVQNSYVVNSRVYQRVHADSGTFTDYITAERTILTESLTYEVRLPPLEWAPLLSLTITDP